MCCVLEANSNSLSSHVGRSFSSDVRAEARTHMKYGARQLSCEDALQVGSARGSILESANLDKRGLKPGPACAAGF
jgi:hypothetical protein